MGGGGGGWKYKQEPDEKETKKHVLKISENGNRERELHEGIPFSR
jgi:hypothetical protein